MTTETILTPAQIEELSAKHLWAHAQFVGAGDVHIEGDEAFARAIEQAVLQSPEIQALRKDARRYGFAADHCVLGGGVHKFGWPIAPASRPEWDRYIDAAMEKQL